MCHSTDRVDHEVSTDLDEIPDGASQLHWALRWLALLPPEVTSRRLCRIARHLEHLRYQVRTDDLIRFFQLVGTAPKWPNPRRQLENLAWSPTASAELFRRLASEVDAVPVVAAVFERSEELAAAVAPKRAEGFVLRRDLIASSAARLFAVTRRRSYLYAARKRLLPEEEDHLWLAAVEALMALHEGGTSPAPLRKTDEARQSLTRVSRYAMVLAKRIQSPRPRARARLRASTSPDLLEGWLPASEVADRLYSMVFDAGVVEDELLALAPLCEAINDPSDWARYSSGRIRNPDRRIEALIDLALHSLECQRQSLPRRLWDPIVALLPLSSVSGISSSERRRLALIPELVIVGARAGAVRALHELQEAFLQVLRMTTVDLETRFEVLSALLVRLPAIFFPGSSTRPSHCRAAARFLHWVAGLPNRAQFGTLEFREHWARLLPVFLACPDHLPALARAYTLYPLRTKISVDWLPTLTAHLGLERCWKCLGRVEQVLPRAWRRRSPWRSEALAFSRWVHPLQKTILGKLLGGDPQSFRSLCEATSERSNPEALQVKALVFLAVSREPKWVCRLLNRLPAGFKRDSTCLQLARTGWLPEEILEEMLSSVEDPSTKRLAPVLHYLRTGGDIPIGALPGGITELATMPMDLDHTTLRRYLRRNTWSENSLRALAKAIPDALAQGGRPAGERALCFWLDCFWDGKRGGRFFETVRRASSESSTLTLPEDPRS